jgi:phosphohistidine phosphatase
VIRLLLLRHAKSDRSAPFASDHERPLAERGREAMPAIRHYMKRHRLIPERALVSTAKRTRETWELLAPAFGELGDIRLEDRLYDADLERLLDVIQETPDEVKTLLVIGHNPGLQELAIALIGAGDVDLRQRLHEKLPTAGLLVIDFPAAHWSKLHSGAGRLRSFITPRSLGDG